MPRSSKGSRTITIDGQRLRWRVGDPSPPNKEGWLAQLTVFSLVGGTSRLLAGTTLRSPPYAHWGPPYANWDSRFMPRWVEAIIRRARADGWEPFSPGPDHRLAIDYSQVILETDDLLTTESTPRYPWLPVEPDPPMPK